jgi:hypothetical protein
MAPAAAARRLRPPDSSLTRAGAHASEEQARAKQDASRNGGEFQTDPKDVMMTHVELR